MSHQSVLIKINYANQQAGQTPTQPKMITVWHVPRILAALTVVVAVLVWIWPSSTEQESKPQAEVTALAIPVVKPLEESGIVASMPNPAMSKTGAMPEYRLDTSKPAAVIYDRHVVRAALVAEMNNQQPGVRINPSITINDPKGIELFYFTEIKHPLSQGYAHHWLKDGHLMLKKNLESKGKWVKQVSAKHFSIKDKGVWSVVLINQQGKPLSESRFVIN